jgi:hypothetical protein
MRSLLIAAVLLVATLVALAEDRPGAGDGKAGGPGPALKEVGRGSVTEVKQDGEEARGSLTVRVYQHSRKARHYDLTFQVSTATKFYKLVDGKRERASFEDVRAGQRVIVYTPHGHTDSAAIVDIDTSARE